MRSIIVAVLIASSAAVPAIAQDSRLRVPNPGTPPRPSPAETEARIVHQWKQIEENLELREFDRQAMGEAKRFQDARGAPPPMLQDNGKVVVTYGATTTRLITQPLRVSVIELQPGEYLTSNPHIGDQARWELKPAKSGEGSQEIAHVNVKPLKPDIATSLTIYTNRRTYDIELVSRSKGYMPRLAFRYPEDEQAAWERFRQEQLGRRQNELATYDGPKVTAKDLNFNYDISGSASWKPLRAYDDGRQTYIEFPPAVRYGTAPVLLLVENGQEKQVNYRVQDRYYVVDRLFESAILVQGTGWSKTSITINRS